MIFDKEFLIGVLILSFATWIIPACLMCGIDKWWKVIIAYVIGLAISFGIVCAIRGQHQGELKWYNNGICTECQGVLEFINASRYRSSTTYYYQCDKCGRILEFQTKMQ